VQTGSTKAVYETRSTNTYSISTTTFQRRSLFQQTAIAERMIETLFHYRDEGRYLLHGYVVMPEQLHVLLTPSPEQTIERCVQCVKGGFSHALRAQFPGEIWQQGFHQHRVRDLEDFRNQLKYIAQNPQKRGLQDYAFVHTRSLERLDAISGHLIG